MEHFFVIKRRLDSRIPSHDCMTLMFCSRSPAVDKYLHKETKEKCVYSSFFNPLRECGTAGALVLHPFIFCFSTAGVRDRRSTSSTLTYYSFFSTFIYIIILTAGLREQAINNVLLTEREGRTGEYWPEVVAVRTERSEVLTKTIEGQYSPVRLELARLVIVKRPTSKKWFFKKVLSRSRKHGLKSSLYYAYQEKCCFHLEMFGLQHLRGGFV